MARLSRRFEAQGAIEGVEVVDEALIEAIELRSLLLVDCSIRADGAEKGSGERRIHAFEEFQEDEADRISLREQLVAAGLGKLGDEPFGPKFCEVVAQRGKGVAFRRTPRSQSGGATPRPGGSSAGLAYVAVTRARDLLVVPGCGDQPLTGWLEVINPALYPAEPASG